MVKRILFVVTPQIVNTHRCSDAFLIKAVPSDDLVREFSSCWGVVRLREKGPNHIDFLKMLAGDPTALGDDGKKIWDIQILNQSGMILLVFFEEAAGDPSLVKVLNDIPEGCGILIQSDSEAKIRRACEQAGIEGVFISHRNPLPTS